MNYTQRSAVISDCEQYRYLLCREWRTHGFDQSAAKTAVLFVMLNPSTADGKEDDPTVRRCVGFAHGWGHRRLEIVNLFAHRSTDPRELLGVEDPVGPDNSRYIVEAAQRAHVIVCAWGSKGWINNRAPEVKKLLKPFASKVYALRFTHGGHPQHPLYLPASSELMAFLD